MTSTNIVNFSVRQNKDIERSIAFDCMRLMIQSLEFENLVYIGLGSVWFSDFLLAHRLLGINSMVSIEHDEITFRRANFNKPYRTVEVVHDESTDAIPALLDRGELRGRSWIVWLDYDNEIDQDKLEELSDLTYELPENSMLFCTFSAVPKDYADLRERAAYIKRIFGGAAPEILSNAQCKRHETLQPVLARAVENYLIARTAQQGRAGEFVTMVRLMYRDSTPMVTVGGLLAAERSVAKARQCVARPGWPGILDDAIQTPPLTGREVMALQAQLPSASQLTREDLAKLGFDLDESQLKSFTDHYLRYPQFARIGA